jgi:hypothetical protein
MLVERYGPLIESLQRDLGLARSLVVVGTAFEDLERLMERHRMRTVADVVLHLEHRGLLDVAAAVPNGLRLAIEFGADGEAILATVGAPGVAIAYDRYKEGRSRNAIVQAMGRGGLPAAVAAKKHAASEEFQKIVARDGSAAVQAVAVACSAEEARRALSSNPDRTWTQSLAMAALKLAGDSGEKTIRMIDRDGLDRVESLTNPHLQMYQFLPLYDLSHLASVFTHGYAPTRGEFVWAGVDAVLVAADVLSVLSLQPEVVVATEVARTGLKSTARTSVKAGAQSAATHAGEAVAGQATRQIARETGERLLQRTTEIASRPAEAVGHELAESLARRAGIRLASWHTQSASRFLFASSGKLPHSRLSKYVVANGAQAAVGLIAVRKMEEYLEGRGSSQRNRTDLNL